MLFDSEIPLLSSFSHLFGDTGNGCQQPKVVVGQICCYKVE